MSTVSSPISIVIDRLAGGPTAPAAGGATPLRTRVAEVVAQMGPAPWSRRIIADERNLVTLIASPPGGGNRPHWHREFDEWWVVLAGRLQWELTGGVVVDAAKDDIVWVPRCTISGTWEPSCRCAWRWRCRPPGTSITRASSADLPTTAPANGVLDRRASCAGRRGCLCCGAPRTPGTGALKGERL
jgi:quercetin dioxygenase-like cupin family protein